MNYDTDQRHIEYKVLEWQKDESKKVKHTKDGIPVAKEKRVSDRGIVSITEVQALYNNQNALKTGLLYELEPKPKEPKKPKDESTIPSESTVPSEPTETK